MRLASPDVAAPFIVDVLAAGGSVWTRESSESMAPLLRPGDRLCVAAPDPRRMVCGSLVAYRRDGAVIVHRVLVSDSETVIAKGDALDHADAPVGCDAILGSVVSIERSGRRLDLTRWRWRATGRVLAAVSSLGPRLGLPRLAWRLPFHVIAWMTRSS